MIHSTSFIDFTECPWTNCPDGPDLYLKGICPCNTSRFVIFEECWTAGCSCMSDQSTIYACFCALAAPFNVLCSHDQHFKLISWCITKTFWTFVRGNVKWYRVVLDNNLSVATIVGVVWPNYTVCGLFVSEINTK